MLLDRLSHYVTPSGFALWGHRSPRVPSRPAPGLHPGLSYFTPSGFCLRGDGYYHSRCVWLAAFDSDVSWVMTACEDGKVRFYDSRPSYQTGEDRLPLVIEIRTSLRLSPRATAMKELSYAKWRDRLNEFHRMEAPP